MDKSKIIKYAITISTYLAIFALVTLYSYSRKTNIPLFEFILYSTGYTAFIVSGIYLIFKKQWLSHLANICLGTLATYGLILLSFYFIGPLFGFFIQNMFIFIFLIIALNILFSLLAAYVQGIIKDWVILSLMLVFIIEMIIEKYFNWNEWIKFLQGKENSLLSNSYFPPPSIIIGVFMVIAVSIFLVRLAISSGNKN